MRNVKLLSALHRFISVYVVPEAFSCKKKKFVILRCGMKSITIVIEYSRMCNVTVYWYNLKDICVLIQILKTPNYRILFLFSITIVIY